MHTGSSTLGSLVLILMMFSAASSLAGQKISGGSPTNGAQPVAIDKAPQTAPGETDPAIPKRNGRYTIHASDSLEVSFVETPEFNQTVTVQPDGYITLRNVGDLMAAGQTLPELTESVKTAYSKILQDPEISVEPKDFEKPYFVVGGQVQKPGKFDWRSEVTLTEAIEIAGGFTDAAKHSEVLLFRRVSDQWTAARIINVKKMVNSRNLQEDPELQPGDMLIVPKNYISKIKPFLPTASTGMFYNPATY
jgi:polysaccharide biosynthesis/export protein